MPKIEDLIQKTNKIMSKFNSLSKIVDYVTDELTPNIFKEKTEHIYKLNKKIIDEFIHRI